MAINPIGRPQTEQPSVLGSNIQAIGAGLAAGVLRDPIVGGVIRKTFPGIDDNTAGMLEDLAATAPAGRIAEVVGEFGTILGTGIGAFGIGRIAARAVLGAAVRGVASRAVIAEGAGTLSRIGTFGQRALPRVTEGLGGSVGLGGEEFGRGLVEGEEVTDAFNRGLKIAGLTALIDFALVGGAAAFNPRGRFLQTERTLTRRGGEKTIGELQSNLEKLTTEREALTGQITAGRAERGRILGLKVSPRTGELIGESQFATTDDAISRAQTLASANKTLGRQTGVLTRRINRINKDLESSKKTYFEKSRDVFRTEIAKLDNQISTTKERIFKIETEIYAKEIESAVGAPGFGPGATLDLTGNTPKEVIKLRGKLSTAERQLRAFSSQREAFELALDKVIPQEALLTEVPTNPKGIQLFIEDFLTKTIKSPDTVLRKQGRTGALIAELLGGANAEAEVLAEEALVKHRTILQRIGKATGTKRKALLQKLDDIRQVAEDPNGLGIESVRQQFGDDVAKAFQEHQELMSGFFQQMRKLGGEEALDTTAAGVSIWTPHRIRFLNVDDDAIISKIIANERKSGRTIDRVQARQILNRFRSTESLGLRKMGHVDFNRNLTGTAAQKAETLAGVAEVESYFRSTERYIREASHRIGYGKRFGADGKLAEAFVEAVGAEGGSTSLTNTILNYALGNKYHEYYARKLARTVTSAEIMMKLGFAAIPNFTQQINNTLFFGLRTQARSLGIALAKEDRQEVMKSLGLMESSLDASRRGILDAVEDSFIDRASTQFLKMVGFSTAERMNRTMTGAAAIHLVRDTTSKLSRGALRGSTYELRKRQLGMLGFDIDTLAARVKAGKAVGASSMDRYILPREMDEIVLRAVQTTQFPPTPTSLPLWWRTPAGRIITQFKSFAYNQAKFLSNNVLVEAGRGNYKPLAYFLSIYPLAGEAVNFSISAIKGRDRRHGVVRAVEDFAAVGGFGLAYAAFVSARFGDIEQFVTGPFLSDVFAASESVFQIDRSSVLRRNIVRQPAFQLGRILLEGGEEVYDLLDNLQLPGGSG